jgi:hypothetical protein
MRIKGDLGKKLVGTPGLPGIAIAGYFSNSGEQEGANYLASTLYLDERYQAAF